MHSQNPFWFADLYALPFLDFINSKLSDRLPFSRYSLSFLYKKWIRLDYCYHI